MEGDDAGIQKRGREQRKLTMLQKQMKCAGIRVCDRVKLRVF